MVKTSFVQMNIIMIKYGYKFMQICLNILHFRHIVGNDWNMFEQKPSIEQNIKTIT